MKDEQDLHSTASHFSEVSESTAMAYFYGLKINHLSVECLLAKTTLQSCKTSLDSVRFVYSQLHSLWVGFPTLIKLLQIELKLAVNYVLHKVKDLSLPYKEKKTF